MKSGSGIVAYLAAILTALLLQNISHELRLQFLGAGLAANVDRTFAHSQTFIPR